MPVVRLPIKIDNCNGKLKNGSFLELELSPGIHSIFARRGYFLGSGFPPASTNVSGSSGERRYFSYVMQYGMAEVFISINEGGFFLPMQRPIQAVWKEITQQEFESQFPHAKFNN